MIPTLLEHPPAETAPALYFIIQDGLKVEVSQRGWKRDRNCPKHGQREFSFRDAPDDWIGCRPCAEQLDAYAEMIRTNR